jgi:hypothetical protein
MEKAQLLYKPSLPPGTKIKFTGHPEWLPKFLHYPLPLNSIGVIIKLDYSNVQFHGQLVNIYDITFENPLMPPIPHNLTDLEFEPLD